MLRATWIGAGYRESSNSNKFCDSRHRESLEARGASAHEIDVGNNENENDIIIPPGQLSYSVDDSLPYLTNFRFPFYGQTWKFFSKEV